MGKFHEFLQLGYISSTNDSKKFDYKFNQGLTNLTENELINKAKELLIKEIEENIKDKDQLLIPISGGLDSRLILSAVSECRSLTEVNTLTYGTKGSLDYEIGSHIANKMGTKHTEINLMKHTFNLEDLYEFAQNVDRPTVLFHNIPYSKINQNKYDLLLSGFLGDVASGKRFNFENVEKENDIVKEEYFKSMFQRHNFNVDNKELLNKLMHLPQDSNFYNLTYKEIVYIKEHNLKINVNQVYAAFNNVDIFTPFYNTEFMNFLLSLPHKYKLNQTLYKKLIFEKMNENLANIPVKNFYGSMYTTSGIKKKIIRSKNSLIHKMSNKFENINSPYVNYVDFRKKMILDLNFKKMILDLLLSLKNRKITLYENEINKAIYSIEKNKIDNPYNSLLLASLEVYIRLGKININE